MDIGVLGGQPWLFYQTGDMENLNFSSSGYRLYALNTARASVGDPLTIEDLDELIPIQGTSTSVNGWYMNFRTSPTEIPTTPVTYYNGYLFFGTFSGDLLDPCAIGGSRFYAVNAMTGEGAWGDGKKYVDLSGLQITELQCSMTAYILGLSAWLPSRIFQLLLAKIPGGRQPSVL
jgi:type IV pilus assembly protein PilY1